MSEPSSPRDWQTLYAAAMLEGDSTPFQPRIERAEEAIQARMRELPQKFFVGPEQAELRSALQNLRHRMGIVAARLKQKVRVP